MPFLGDPPEIGAEGHFAASHIHNRLADCFVVAPRATGNATQDTANIQAAITEAQDRAVGSGKMLPIFFVPDDYYVDTIGVQNCYPLIYGNGSIFHWRGAPDGTMWDCPHAREGLFADMECRFSQAYPGRAGFHWHRSNAPRMNYAPTRMKWERVRVYGYPGSVEYGWDTVGEVDQNVDLGVWDNCTVQFCTKAGWRLGTTQGYLHRFIDCNGDGSNTCLCAVEAAYGMFSWEGGSLTAHTRADFDIRGWGQQPYIIKNTRSEESDRFMIVRDSVRPFIDIEDVTVDGENVNPDGRSIVFENTSTAVVSIRQFKLGGGQNIPFQFDFDGIASNGHIRLEDVHVQSPVVPNPPWGSRAPDKTSNVALVNPAVGESIAVTRLIDIG